MHAAILILMAATPAAPVASAASAFTDADARAAFAFYVYRQRQAKAGCPCPDGSKCDCRDGLCGCGTKCTCAACPGRLSPDAPKTCPCSTECTCGCVAGVSCSCGNQPVEPVTSAELVTPAVPSTFVPRVIPWAEPVRQRVVPVRRGGGGGC